MYQTTTYASPVGELTLASDGTALTGLWLEGQKHFGGTSSEELAPGQPDLPVFQAARAWLDRYFSGETPSPAERARAPEGTPFQRAVWEKLQAIPWGSVTTYGALARELDGASPRAVGGAVGRNPISIIIPCHRVVGTGGSLTGYAGGVKKKAWLLAHEGVDLSAFTLPTRGTAL